MQRRRFLGLAAGVVATTAWSACTDRTTPLDGPDGGAGGPDDEDGGDTDDAGANADGGQPADDAGTPDAGPPPIDDDARLDGGQLVQLDVEGIAVDDARFFLGVQAGAMRGRDVSMWTRVPLLSTTSLTLRVWRDAPAGSAATSIVLVQTLTLAPDVDGTAKIRVRNLAPGARYHYAFFTPDDAARSAIGRVRMPFADDVLAPVTIGGTTCTKIDRAPFATLSQLAHEELDLFVHAGDMVYADGARNRSQFRAHWEDALRTTGYRDLLVRQGGYFAWDDHEFDNNINPETADPELIAAAKAEFFSSTPMTPDEEHGGLWQSFRWGRSVELFVLDCRTERRPSTRTSDAAVYIGVQQMAWLKRGLRDSPCRFKVVVNSVPMTHMPTVWPDGDRWEGYDAQRRELLSWLQAYDVRDVWFLSGDFHVGFVGRVETSGFHRHTFEVAMGPGGNLNNPLGFIADAGIAHDQVFPPDQFPYGRNALAATTLRFDPIAGTVQVRFLDEDGGVLFDGSFDSTR